MDRKLREMSAVRLFLTLWLIVAGSGFAVGAIVYRTDGVWGSGKGSSLTWAEMDGNFWQLSTATSGWTGRHYTNELTPSDVITKAPVLDVRSYLGTSFVTDGSVDYTTQIQNAINYLTTSSPSGGTLLLPKGKWQGNVTLYRGIQLVGMGIGATTLYAPSTSPVVALAKIGTTAPSGWGIRNLTLEGSGNVAYTGNAGVEIDNGSENGAIENVEVKDSGGPGLNFSGDDLGAYNTTVRNVRIIGHKGPAVYITGAAQGNLFENVNSQGGYGSGFVFEYTARNATLGLIPENNTFVNCSYSVTANINTGNLRGWRFIGTLAPARSTLIENARIYPAGLGTSGTDHIGVDVQASDGLRIRGGVIDYVDKGVVLWSDLAKGVSIEGTEYRVATGWWHATMGSSYQVYLSTNAELLWGYGNRSVLPAGKAWPSWGGDGAALAPSDITYTAGTFNFPTISTLVGTTGIYMGTLDLPGVNLGRYVRISPLTTINMNHLLFEVQPIGSNSASLLVHNRGAPKGFTTSTWKYRVER